MRAKRQAGRAAPSFSFYYPCTLHNRQQTTNESETMKVQEFVVTMEVMMVIHDSEKELSIDEVQEYAKKVLEVRYNDENAGNAPVTAGDDATTSIGADIIKVGRIPQN